MEQARQSVVRVIVTALTLSAAGFGTWKANEGFGANPYIPTKGDVPTIGHGSTRYEDGTPVRMTDPPITRERASQLARGLAAEDEKRLIKSLPDVVLLQGEFDLYMDFLGQFGYGNWTKPQSPRTWLLRGDYVGACQALEAWRFQAGRDCRLPVNWGPQGCRGVWLRQERRIAACMEMQK
ncbi:lysozyme [Diaphorobacter sp. HDW4A]|uniref:lysozyme n=1 Tax=Diaphorobacter sp. HDW4A TaxID=2714924 RepID=UPI001407DF82|nr:lysozyme [Diaphorobacter sp. HDW4A]QIL80825.1 lysozyme [Diaphorobacter sp. HDW4A]QIL83578.1 lysozyme [Diaphorobacter sp. HDW4A]